MSDPTDFRALCAQLVQGWDDLSFHDAGGLATFVEDVRAALPAEPQEGVSDEELMDAYWKGAGLVGDGTDGHILTGLRAVLTRYAPTPAPVAVDDRLPDRSDCDSKGQCWWFLQSENCNIPTWALGPYRIRQGTWRQTHWLPATALPLPEI